MMRCLPLSLLAFWAIPAGAHESLPGFLEILERKPGTYQVIWKVPAIEGAPPAIAFEIPPACHTLGETNSPLTPGALTERWLMQCSPTLLGQRIELGCGHGRLAGTGSFVKLGIMCVAEELKRVVTRSLR